MCAVSLTALMMRESTASRDPVVPAGSIAAGIGNPDAQNGANFDNAIQDAVSDSLPVPSASDWITVTIKPGQTLSTIIENLGMPTGDWLELAALGNPTAALKHLRAGEKIHLRINADGHLDDLSYEVDEMHTLQVRRVNDRLEAVKIEAALEHRPTQADGVITSSLFDAGQKAGLSDRLIMRMTELFGYDVDFALDLRRGDRFAVVYDAVYKDGVKLRNGDILAAEFINNGHAYRVMRYVSRDGTSAYYTPQGQSLRKAFIRTPVDFVRISSGFNLHRRHPILNTIRAHKGVDYAAPIGTPVKATADGHIEFIGVMHGFGNMIKLRHGRQYETFYGHLSRFRRGLREGSRVRQGEVIAYVGMTGLATGPHLHYEFRVNGVPKNPVTVALPRANPLTRTQLAHWHTQNKQLLAQLDAAIQGKTVAQISPAKLTGRR
ncbi:MAG: OapA family protein [Stenotrophobium sp.]